MIFLKETNHHRENKPTLALINLPAIKQAFQHPIIGTTLLFSLIYSAAHQMMVFGFQAKSVDELLFSGRQIAIQFTIFGLIMIFCQIVLVPWLQKHSNYHKTLISSMLFCAGLMLLIGQSTSMPWFIAFTWLYIICYAPISALISGAVSNATKPEDQGGVMGITQSVNSMAQIIGPLTAGLLISKSTQLSYQVTSIFYLLAMFLVLKSKTTTQKLNL